MDVANQKLKLKNCRKMISELTDLLTINSVQIKQNRDSYYHYFNLLHLRNEIQQLLYSFRIMIKAIKRDLFTPSRA